MLLLLGWTPFNTLLIPRQSRRTGGLRVIALCRLLLLSAPRKLVEEGARAPGPHSPVQELDFLPRVVEIHSGFHEKNWIKTIIQKQIFENTCVVTQHIFITPEACIQPHPQLYFRYRLIFFINQENIFYEGIFVSYLAPNLISRVFFSFFKNDFVTVHCAVVSIQSSKKRPKMRTHPRQGCHGSIYSRRSFFVPFLPSLHCELE